LGRWGYPVTVAALVYGIVAMFILAKPSTDMSLSFVDRWIALIGFVIVAVVGLVYLLVAKPEARSAAPEGDANEVAATLRAGVR
jgi:membrane protein YdbS with pleckstrin-like domain